MINTIGDVRIQVDAYWIVTDGMEKWTAMMEVMNVTVVSSNCTCTLVWFPIIILLYEP